MPTQYYDVVIAGDHPNIVDVAVDESFHRTFGKAIYFKRLRELGRTKLTVFSARAEQIDKKDVSDFERGLGEKGYTVLYSGLQTGGSGAVYAYFFRFTAERKKFGDVIDLLIEKIEEIIGKKIDFYEGIYYFNLTKSQFTSKKLKKDLEEILSFSIIENVYV